MGINDAALQAKGAKTRVHHAVPQPSFLERFSTLSQVLRVISYIMRFKDNASGKVERRFGPLGIEELDYALLAVVRIVQRESFATDLSAVKNSKRLPSRSKLLKLSPILEEGILRVKRRLAKFLSFLRISNTSLAQSNAARRCAVDCGTYASAFGS